MKKGREGYALPSVSTFSTEGSALRLPVAGFSVMPLTASESVKKRQCVFRSRGRANPHHSAPSRAEQSMADLIVQTNLVGYVLNAETDHDLGAIQEFGNFDAMFGGMVLVSLLGLAYAWLT